ncbi:metallophosphoesterase family protein [Methanopyrus sp.]
MNVRIIHISDLHISPYRRSWDPEVFYRGVEQINELGPDVVIVTGDLTDNGLVREYEEASSLLERIEAPVVPVPGNHDARNLGWMTFEDVFGDRYRVERVSADLYVVGLDSSEPDVNYGQLGRERQEWLEETLRRIPDSACKCIAMHHHLIPVPGAGRERNVLVDAGEMINLCIKYGVDLVLCGHRHVPFVAKVEDTVVVNAGTFSATKLRGYSRNSFNVIEFSEDVVSVNLREIMTERELELARYKPVVKEGEYRLVRVKGMADVLRESA